MNEIRRSNERGYADHGWLKSFHTFSFADYYDPNHVEFGPLRVINEDRVQAGAGFGTHAHRDMEIISYVLSGELAHKDSMGNGSTIRPGDIQRMSAGSGVRHSEFNPSPKDSTHLLQIWIVPDRKNLKPQYEQLTFPDKDLRGKFHLVAGPEAPVNIHQDANLYIARLNEGEQAKHPLKAGRSAWMQVSHGTVAVNGTKLKAGDGAAISEESEVRVEATKPSEVLLFDLA